MGGMMWDTGRSFWNGMTANGTGCGRFGSAGGASERNTKPWMCGINNATDWTEGEAD